MSQLVYKHAISTVVPAKPIKSPLTSDDDFEDSDIKAGHYQ